MGVETVSARHVSMIWNNFAIVRTHCAIARSTLSYMPRASLPMSCGGNDAFGPQLNPIMSVGILLKYFRCKLLKLE